jgi:Ser/Thr protein kinase RdoA (MazF antagonist)
VLKGIRCERPTGPGRIEALLTLLPAKHFPKLVALRGAALLTDWIPGVPLQPQEWTPTLLRECGQLQAAMHRVPVPLQPSVPLRRRSPAWEQLLDEYLRRLVSAQALTADEGHAVRQVVERHAPARTHLAVCHGDFCAENIVKDGAGHFYVVDNETVAVDACEYDLARTWYRWPMTSAQRAAYQDGYGQSPMMQSFTAHLPHFASVVLAESAAYRLTVHPSSAHIPLERLRTLLSEAGA